MVINNRLKIILLLTFVTALTKYKIQLSEWDVILLLVGMYIIGLFNLKKFSACNMYVCPLNKLSPFTVDVRFYLQIQYWEYSECGIIFQQAHGHVASA